MLKAERHIQDVVGVGVTIIRIQNEPPDYGDARVGFVELRRHRKRQPVQARRQVKDFVAFGDRQTNHLDLVSHVVAEDVGRREFEEADLVLLDAGDGDHGDLERKHEGVRGLR